MSGPIPDGSYHIVPTFILPPPIGVGADTNTPPDRPGASLPVVYNGANQVWTAKHHGNGNYYLSLGGWESVDYDHKVSVNPSILTGRLWHIELRPGSSDCYHITRFDENMVWTLPSTDGEHQVVLQPPVAPYNLQEWYFRSVD